MLARVLMTQTDAVQAWSNKKQALLSGMGCQSRDEQLLNQYAVIPSYSSAPHYLIISLAMNNAADSSSLATNTSVITAWGVPTKYDK